VRRRFISVERLEAVARAALAGGYGRLCLTSEYDGRAPGKPRRVVLLDIKHDCDQPYTYELHARYSARHGKTVRPMMVRGTARCRKCEKCMDYRGNQWKKRAVAEYYQHAATLFGTFTMAPEQHYLLDAEIAAGIPDEGIPACDLRGLTAQELFDRRVQAFGRRLTKYIWRLRKGRSGEKPHLRYLLVAEMHDGEATSDIMRRRPHYHLMLHTNTLSALVRGDPLHGDGEWFHKIDKKGRLHIMVHDAAWLRTQWPFGFTTFELATSASAAWYVCKYVSKSLASRVRASQGYGTRSADGNDDLFKKQSNRKTGPQEGRREPRAASEASDTARTTLHSCSGGRLEEAGDPTGDPLAGARCKIKGEVD